MKKTVYIHTNNKQRLGAKLAKYAIEKSLSDTEIQVQQLNVDSLEMFKQFAGTQYLRGGKVNVYDPKDLQSFTLSRFMPPALNGYEGRAMVIDPDIFALKDISPLFNMDMEGKDLICCAKKDAFDTSMMVMDCGALRHWSMEKILQDLKDKKADYVNIMTLKWQIATKPGSIKTVPRIYNNLDTITDDTVFLHTTDRLTQPWSTGLPIDFKRNDPGRYFGFIPKVWLLKLRGKWPSTYQPHPDKKVESFFLTLFKEALDKGVITKEEIDAEIAVNRLRKDIWEKIKTI
ncbi:MAG: hypothetical protein RJB39_780 [Candidatus Parcubacteria bacterium]|jgi:hypothetical protein